ncbi:TFIIB-type zinc ribbon-containing protein [Fuscibacter oryzae]|uniref:Zf-TFIIB domain-containing protein n=1 Tax=Fuscibacter oryzae TaxID=2803939 RepID=A0A8J7ST78_9RHOB|nr:zf-TFIIB domain-containing protein [Fuscibacter oryzae]MBL4928265.1 zf-TFIIB domain-containing protein [Fuscibacter oryzae]
MRCPTDGETLVMADRNGVEIDYCPKCRGVWLDRGELDKIIERAGAAAPVRDAAPVYQPEPGRPPRQEELRRYRDDDDDDHRHGGKRKRRESFLGDLFDF